MHHFFGADHKFAAFLLGFIVKLENNGGVLGADHGAQRRLDGPDECRAGGRIIVQHVQTDGLLLFEQEIHREGLGKVRVQVVHHNFSALVFEPTLVVVAQVQYHEWVGFAERVGVF